MPVVRLVESLSFPVHSFFTSSLLAVLAPEPLGISGQGVKAAKATTSAVRNIDPRIGHVTRQICGSGGSKERCNIDINHGVGIRNVRRADICLDVVWCASGSLIDVRRVVTVSCSSKIISGEVTSCEVSSGSGVVYSPVAR